MAFWNRDSGLARDVGKSPAGQLGSIELDRVWREASTAMQCYLDFRTE